MIQASDNLNYLPDSVLYLCSKGDPSKIMTNTTLDIDWAMFLRKGYAHTYAKKLEGEKVNKIDKFLKMTNLQIETVNVILKCYKGLETVKYKVVEQIFLKI